MGGGWAEPLECLPAWDLDHLQGAGQGEDAGDPGAGSDTEVKVEDRNLAANVSGLGVHRLLTVMTTWMQTPSHSCGSWPCLL